MKLRNTPQIVRLPLPLLYLWTPPFQISPSLLWSLRHQYLPLILLPAFHDRYQT